MYRGDGYEMLAEETSRSGLLKVRVSGLSLVCQVRADTLEGLENDCALVDCQMDYIGVADLK